jgi:hypothetical protein
VTTQTASGQTSFSAQNTATLIVPARAGRTELRIRGLADIQGGAVFIGGDNTVTAATGYPIASGPSEYLISIEGEVWATKKSGTDFTVTVQYLEIFA